MNLKMQQVHDEIVALYMKIKRCSKDISVTESQYAKYHETPEDRSERNAIEQMDPLTVLQYINVSIDVIINLKFEDIELKIREHGATGGSSMPLKQSQLMSDDRDETKQRSRNDSPKLEDLVVEDTPQNFRDKVKKKPRTEVGSQRSERVSESGSSICDVTCPRIYEEIIQGLEAEVRKHIRIEH